MRRFITLIKKKKVPWKVPKALLAIAIFSDTPHLSLLPHPPGAGTDFPTVLCWYPDGEVTQDSFCDFDDFNEFPGVAQFFFRFCKFMSSPLLSCIY